MAIRLLVSSLLLTGSVHSFRVAKSKGKANLSDIACPVMGALVNHGIIPLDKQGRATQDDTIKGLMWTGNSPYMASFQGKGIASFKDADVHQEYRERKGDIDGSNLYLNYYTWNPLSKCDGTGPTLSNGMPCNANVGFQNHGFSTSLRDPTDAGRWGGSADERWDYWMGLPDVLVNLPGVTEKVMTLSGLGALLKEARLNGEKSGEFSLNSANKIKNSNLQFYHPSVDTNYKQNGCAQWQGVGAWAAFWALFATKESNGVYYISESDLKVLFFDARFPPDFKPFAWGWKETMEAVVNMKGMGVGDVWVNEIEILLGNCRKYGLSEECLTQGMLTALAGLGARDDDIFKTYS